MQDEMRTSARGIAFIERFENVVLKAYRDAGGVWTIGAGLTRASGVIDPGPGMVITRDQAAALMARALAGNYEPRVNNYMPDASQHAFDGGVSFDWNTGAIHKASWVRLWRDGKREAFGASLARWNKAGGQVLRGLERRRREEFALIADGIYADAAPVSPAKGNAPVIVPLDNAGALRLRDGFAKLGYETGASGVPVESVRKFQLEHDLTVDGIIGRATLATLERRLSAPSAIAKPAASAAAGGAATGSDVVDVAALPDWIVPAVLGVCAFWLLWRLWHYRDVVAVKVQRMSPTLAGRLRSR